MKIVQPGIEFAGGNGLCAQCQCVGKAALVGERADRLRADVRGFRFRFSLGPETGDGGRETEDGGRRMEDGLRSPVSDPSSDRPSHPGK